MSQAQGPAAERSTSFGQARALNPVDRAGVWMRFQTVRRHVDLDGKRLGDFGCGYDASMARAALDRVSSALLVDLQIAPEVQEHPKVTAVEGSIDEVLPGLEPGSLDVVICLAVLEHLWDPEQTLSEYRRLLAPGGVMLVDVPSWRAKPLLEFAAFRLGLATDEMDDHKRYFDPRDLWPMLVDAGFTPSAIRCRRNRLGFGTFAVCRLEDDPAGA